MIFYFFKNSAGKLLDLVYLLLDFTFSLPQVGNFEDINLKSKKILVYFRYGLDEHSLDRNIEELRLRLSNWEVVELVNLDKLTSPIQTTGRLFRPNVGLDLGALGHFLRSIDLRRLDYLVYLNDTIEIDVNTILKAIDQMELTRTSNKVYGLTLSLQKSRHLQSFFLALPNKYLSIASKRLRSFRHKRATVAFCEIGLSRELIKAGAELVPLISNSTLIEKKYGSSLRWGHNYRFRNPSIYYKSEIKLSGYPFRKKRG
jgi:hypothetical protein